ncbi:hypothetical protein AX16_008834 [Volvariella volvacea WC 439]|nr:hypothetical protein AX16_008834 [Volvariella volvacea WC 439]
MKRKAEETLKEGDKRRKLTDASPELLSEDNTAMEDPFDGLTLVDAASLLENDPNDTSYISAKIIMAWPPTSKEHRALLKTHQGEHKFEICITGKCTTFGHQLRMKSQQEISLSLKGCQVIRVEGVKRSCTLAMKLNFEDGVIMKLVDPNRQVRVVDTWSYEAMKFDDDWFSTPAVVPQGRLSLVAQLTSKEPKLTPTPNPNPPAEAPALKPTSHANATIPPKLNPRNTDAESDAKVHTNTTAQFTRQPPSEEHTPRISQVRDITIKPLSTTLPNTNDKPTSLVSETGLTPVPKPTPASNQPPGPTTPKQQVAPPVRPKPLEDVQKGPAGLSTDMGNHAESGLTKKQQKRLRKRERAKEANNTATRLPEGTGAQNGVQGRPAVTGKTGEANSMASRPPINSRNEVIPETQRPVSGGGAGGETPSNNNLVQVAVDSPQPQPEAPASPLELKAGFRTSSYEKYEALDSPKVNSLLNFVGVVVSIKEPRITNRGEWMTNVKLVDSSIATGGLGGINGFGFNIFTKDHTEWLPSANIGDILILRQIKIREYDGKVSGVGYCDKYQWATYDLKTKEIHHGPPHSAPSGQPLANGGYGVVYSPFFNPGPDERAYCEKLAAWWKELPKPGDFDKADNLVVCATGVGFSSPRSGRLHRLIRDAGPDVPPQGYFNCTVEVLQGYKTPRGIFNLYVTDYTSNPGLSPCVADWCPKSLSDQVLLIEMWDKAAELGPQLLTGEYYTFENVRMRRSTGASGGYLEAKVVEKKISPAPKQDPHFIALLERKKAWGESVPKESKTDFEFDHMLFKDALVDKWFDCTVELLKYVDDGRWGSYVYVTDYTRCPEYSAKDASGPWTAGYEDSIVKIFLADKQAELYKDVKPGYYRINRLRLKHSAYSSFVTGRLGGSQMSLQLISPNNTTLAEFADLKRRKKEWQTRSNPQEVPETPLEPRKADTIPVATQKTIVVDSSESAKMNTDAMKIPEPERVDLQGNTHQQECCTIQEVLEYKGKEAKFRIAMKVVDFYPLRLEDCLIVTCTKCEGSVPKNSLACLKCQDMDREYVKYSFKTFLKLEDEKGDSLIAVVDEDSKLLGDIVQSDIPDRSVAYSKFCGLMAPILGNLEKVHKGLIQEEEEVLETDFFYFIVSSWSVSDVEKVHYVSHCEGRVPVWRY